MNNNIATLRGEIDVLVPLISDTKADWNKKKALLEEFDEQFKYRSVDELTTYCDTLVQPAATYYQGKFNNSDGDHYKVKQYARVAQLFNPFFVKEISIAALELLADDLTFFGHGYDSIFTDAFIANLKCEIPALIQEAKKEFDWDSLRNSKQY